MQALAVEGEGALTVRVAQITEQVKERAGGLGVERVGGDGVLEVRPGIGQPAGAGQGAAQGGAMVRLVRTGQDGLVVVGEVVVRVVGVVGTHR